MVVPIVEVALTVAAPPERVWSVLADVPGQPRWMRDLVRVELEGDAPVGVGTRAVGTVRMLGLTQRDPIEIVAFAAPRHFAIRHLGRFSGRGDIWLEPRRSSAATRLRWREELWSPLASLGAPGRLADRGFGPIFAAVFRADLRRLRSIVESEAP